MAFVLKRTLKLTEGQLDITLRAVRKLYPELTSKEKKEIRSALADLLVGGLDTDKSSNVGNRNAYQREYRARMKKAKTRKTSKKKVAKKKSAKKTTAESK